MTIFVWTLCAGIVRQADKLDAQCSGRLQKTGVERRTAKYFKRFTVFTGNSPSVR